MVQRKKSKALFMLFLSVITILFCATTAYADMGPKDQLTVRVKNPPQELYYLDLLTQDEQKYKNYSTSEKQDDLKALNSNMISLLSNYEKEGWYPALLKGTKAPMWGNFIGKKDGDTMVHTFSYFGVPKTYRIIIVTESGKVTASDVYTRKTMQSSITYDYKSGTASVFPEWFAYCIQFFATCIPTLLIEGIILILFRFSLKKNWKVFLLVNGLTQIILTLTMGITLIHSGPFSAYLVQFPVELAIVIAETAVYRRYLKEHSTARRVAYGITANLASWGVGIILMNMQFEFLTSLL